MLMSELQGILRKWMWNISSRSVLFGGPTYSSRSKRPVQILGIVRYWLLNYLVSGVRPCGCQGCMCWRERERGPGLKRAGSILSGRFVAAITVTSTL